MSGLAAAAVGWTFALTPYVWLPNANGTLRFDPPGNPSRPNADPGPNDVLENLQLALMAAFEARKGNWAILSDFIYLDFSKDSASVKSVSGPGGKVQAVDTGSQASLKGLVWQVAASRTLGESGSVEALGGLRTLVLDSELDWQLAAPAGGLAQSGSVSQKRTLTDAIVGVRGKIHTGEGNWFFPYYLDVGTGSASLTWQGFAGVGYSFKWGDALLTYRHLHYEQGGDKLAQSLDFGGPAFGATFRF